VHAAGAPIIQNLYPDDLAHCYGCGRLNAAGLHVHSTWDGAEAVARFTPQPWHISLPGFVYGGLVASLIDCHAMAAAAAASAHAAGQKVGQAPLARFVTASLKVDYLQPTPLGPEIELRARPREATARKTIVDVTVTVNGVTTARGEVVAVRMPESMRRNGS
jgi:acyl-coenzyme A thioesterase PaaI-like protein